MSAQPSRRMGWAWAGFVFALLYLPIVCLVVFSFTAGEITTQLSGFSLRWYRELLQDGELLAAALLSLKIAALTATAALVVGTATALAVVRHAQTRSSGVLAGLATAPMVLPEVVVGLSLVLLFTHPWLSFLGGRGLGAIWIGHVTLALGYVAVLVASRLREMDRSLEEAARDLGCPPWKVFFVITVPVIAPTLAAAWLLAFTLSLDDFVLSAMLSSPGHTTLPVLVWSRLHHGLTPEINALASVIVLCVAIAVLVMHRLMVRSQRRRLATAWR
jgi:putrescine transport system permease protein